MSDMTWSEELVSPPTMTLREYYAGLAMQGIMTTGPNEEYSRIVRKSVQIADDLIAELQREDSDE